ncbi:MAG: hypothetical protein AMXMBFR13_15740 [Phycisphaerae bacterium]
MDDRIVGTRQAESRRIPTTSPKAGGTRGWALSQTRRTSRRDGRGLSETGRSAGSPAQVGSSVVLDMVYLPVACRRKLANTLHHHCPLVNYQKRQTAGPPESKCISTQT